MTTAATDVRDLSNRWRLGRWHPVVALLGGVALLLGIGLRYQSAAPAPPAVDLQDVDPAATTFVEEAYQVVHPSPWSAEIDP